jgi:hypothetical protein
MSAQSLKKVKRPRVVRTLVTIIADFEGGKRAVVRNVEADLGCSMEVHTEMKKARFHQL